MPGLDLLNQQNLSYGLIFLIGLGVSLHCVGMCGGLVVSYTTQNKTGKYLQHLQYNFGRVFSYTMIGGILGALGSFITLNNTVTGVITLAAAVFMLIYGSSLLIGFKFRLPLPLFIARYLYAEKRKIKLPFFIGLLNGFMPCAPLQAMQIYALSTHGAVSGAISMLVYGLGTVPALFIFGAILSKLKTTKIKQITKFAGIIVIILSLIMVNRGLANFGLSLKQVFSGPQNTTQINLTGETQIVEMHVTGRGYEPSTLNLKVNQPVEWVIWGDQITGCSEEILLPDYGISQALKPGKNVIQFTPTKTGTIYFTCGMKMLQGKFIIK